MRHSGLFVLGMLAAAACDGSLEPPKATLDQIPDAFLGRWDRSLADCGAGSDLAVTVAPTELTFPDSHVEVTGVAPDGLNAARVDGRFSNASAAWEGSVRLELTPDGMLDVVNGATLTPRVKCP